MYELARERVGNTQRTAVLELLSSALEQGYLDLHEYEVRLTRVTESKVVGDLYAQVADLPAQFRWDPRQASPKSRADHDRETAHKMALLGLICGAAAVPLSLCFGMGAPIGAAAIVTSVRALRLGYERAMAISGFFLAMVGIALSVVFWLAMFL